MTTRSQLVDESPKNLEWECFEEESAGWANLRKTARKDVARSYFAGTAGA